PAFKVLSRQDDVLKLGLHTWVFTTNTSTPRARAIDAAIDAMVTTGIRECDVCAQLLDPAEIVERIPIIARGQQLRPDVAAARMAAQQELTRWHASVPMDFFRGVRARFNNAGIEIRVISFFPSATAEQLARTMDIAEALGAHVVASIANLPVLRTL